MPIPATVPVTGPIAPTVEYDPYPSHLALYGKGGHRTVTTIAERDEIPVGRREEGMLVWVIEAQKRYRLESDLVSWVEDTFELPPVSGNTIIETITLSFAFDPATNRLKTTVPLAFVSADASLYIDRQKVACSIVRELDGSFSIYMGPGVTFQQAQLVLIRST